MSARRRSKKKIKVIIAGILVALCLISLSETATLRAAVFVTFAPTKAFTMEFEESNYSPEDVTLYIIRKNPPVERATQCELTTWAVKSIGPFHYAYYYGEG